MINIGALIGSNYIKYDRMTLMTNEVFAGSNATEVTIYIDLYSIIRPLLSNKIFNPANSEDYELAAYIINMVGHYRKFFWSRYKVTTKFHFVYSYNFTSKAYSSIFGTPYKESTDNMEYIQNNLRVVNMIAPYLTDVNYANSLEETSAVILELINSNPATTNIIITKDIPTMQVVACNNTVIYRPKKFEDKDISSYITKFGLIPYLLDVRNSTYKLSCDISPELLSIILSISSCPERYFKSVLTIPTALKAIERGVSDNMILNGYNDIMNILCAFNSKEKNKIIMSNCQARFKALDMITQHFYLTGTPDSIGLSREPKNLYDPHGLHQISVEYFSKCPLDLENL